MVAVEQLEVDERPAAHSPTPERGQAADLLPDGGHRLGVELPSRWAQHRSVPAERAERDVVGVQHVVGRADQDQAAGPQGEGGHLAVDVREEGDLLVEGEGLLLCRREEPPRLAVGSGVADLVAVGQAERLRDEESSRRGEGRSAHTAMIGTLPLAEQRPEDDRCHPPRG